MPFDFECEKKLLHNAPQICVHLYFNFVSLALNMHLNVAFFVKRLYSFFFEKKKERKKDLRVAVIVPRPMIQLDKPMGTTSSNWSSETLNPHAPQALLVSGISKNCNYSSCENSNLGCGETLAVTYQLYHTCRW